MGQAGFAMICKLVYPWERGLFNIQSIKDTCMSCVPQTAVSLEYIYHFTTGMLLPLLHPP